MAVPRHALLALLGIALVACGAGAASVNPASQSTGVAQVTLPPVTPTPAVTPDQQPPTEPPTPRPTPKPTSAPVPPKPTGVKLHEETEGFCSDDPQETCAIGDSIYTVSWEVPRTQGVEIRVYGVTTCFGADDSGTMIDGYCLREHTELPSSVRVLLAKAAASEGRVTWRLGLPHSLGENHEVQVYSFVLAAYNAAGKHSIFAIADPGDYCLSSDVGCLD